MSDYTLVALMAGAFIMIAGTVVLYLSKKEQNNSSTDLKASA